MGDHVRQYGRRDFVERLTHRAFRSISSASIISARDVPARRHRREFDAVCRAARVAAPRQRAQQRQRLGAIETPVVKRAAGDRAFELARARLGHLLHVVDRSEPAAGDHRNRDRVGERDRRVPVDALEHAVARHVGVDDRGDAGVLEAPGDVEHASAPTSPPSLRPRPCRPWRRGRPRSRFGNFFAASFTSAGSRTAAVPMMTRLTPLPSQPSIVAMSRMPPPSCTQSPTVSRMRSTADDVHRLAGEGAVEIDDVQMPEALRLERVRLRRRIAVEHGGARHVALLQAHGEAVLQIDGGKQDHGLADSLAVSWPMRFGQPMHVTASISGNWRSAQAQVFGSFPDGIACRPCCRARRSR